jgi:hypothetical protein
MHVYNGFYLYCHYSLDTNKIGDAGAEALGKGLASSTTLKSLW